jgi:hypothetical protein
MIDIPLDILAQSSANIDVWLIAALGAVGGFVAFMVKWILNFMQKQAKENAKMQEKQLEMRGKEVTIQTRQHNTLCKLVEQIEQQNGQVPKALDKVREATERNTGAVNNLCTVLNKRFSTDSFKKAGS